MSTLVLRRTTRIESPIAMLVVGLGLVLAMMAAYMAPPRVGIPVAIGLVVAALLVRRAMRRSTITIDADRVTSRSFGHTRAIDLASVTRYRFVSRDPNATIIGNAEDSVIALGVALAAKLESGDPQHRAFLAGRLALHTGDGRTVEIPATYEGAGAAVEQVLARVHAQLPQAPSFAPFSLDDTALRHDGVRLALAAIEVVAIGRDGRLRITAPDRAAPIELDLSAIDNSLALLERFHAAGVRLEIASQVFLPAPLRAALAT